MVSNPCFLSLSPSFYVFAYFNGVLFCKEFEAFFIASSMLLI